MLALERIIARIGANKALRDKLIFKGGFVLLKQFNSQRFTRDLDALAIDMPKQRFHALIGQALNQDLQDGLYFADPEIDDLVDQGRYGGYRIKVPFQIGPLPKEQFKLRKLSRIHLDVGFGDVILGRPKRSKLQPVIEYEESISWKVYPVESMYAEKLETLVSRGSANSRAKDLYDLVLIFGQVRESTKLASAIRLTFSNRDTEIPKSFLEYFDQLDLTILERSWGSVELSGPKMSFPTCKRKLKGVMSGIDEILNKKTKYKP